MVGASLMEGSRAAPGPCRVHLDGDQASGRGPRETPAPPIREFLPQRNKTDELGRANERNKQDKYTVHKYKIHKY